MHILNTLFSSDTLEIISRLGVATLLGMIIGLERLWAHKSASMRTYAMVAMGAALFVQISEMLNRIYVNYPGLAPTFMSAQIIVGIGFLGAGLFVTKDARVTGITTATGLWVSAGIGMATGFGFYSMAYIATFFILFIFSILWFVESQLKRIPALSDSTNSVASVEAALDSEKK